MDVILNAKYNTASQDASNKIEGLGHCYLSLLHSLGHKPDQLPVASMLSQFYGLDGDWLVLSPVHWQATHNDGLIVACGDDLQLSDEDSESWFNALSDFLETEGYTLFYHDPTFWLISRKSMPSIQTKSVFDMRHRSVFSALLSMDDSLFWQKFITETQMFLSSNPLNQQRSTADKPSINGLWVWGGGEFIQSHSPICADSKLEPIAKVCSSAVIQYSPDLARNDFKHMLISNLNVLSEQHLKMLERFDTRWFWNDHITLIKKTRWWHRLWRKMTHAN